MIEEKASMPFAKFKILNEDRLVTQQNLEKYRHRMSNTFNKWVRVWSFQKGDLVLVIRTHMIIGKRKEN